MEHAPLTALATRDRVRAGDLSPVDAARAAFRRIHERDGEIRAFLGLREERALAEAASLAARDLSALPLAGVPIAVKDNLDVAGEPTAGGSAAVSAGPAEADAGVVRRLREAGAVVVGKTALPELGIWATTDGHWGVTRNPVAPERTPGGSSGGSAAAVAAGMVPLAVGNDGLGSIRIPAAACGLVGLKLGEGAAPVELAGGDWCGMAVNGPLATTVADVALAAAVMADRPELAAAGLPGRDGGGAPLRVALCRKTPLPTGTLDPEWGGTTATAGRRLSDAGHHVEVIEESIYPVLSALPVLARWFVGVADAVTALDAAGVLDPSALEPRSRAHARAGRWIRRLGGPRDGLMRRWRAHVEDLFSRYDALVTPALAHPPIPAHRWSRRSWLGNMNANARYAPYAAPWNLAGVPAGVVPVGTHSTGTPLAVQVVAPWGREDRVLGLMAAIEAGG